MLHVNDHHSTLDAKQQTLVWAEQRQVEGGFPRVGAQIKALRAANDNVLTLRAGDAVTGSLYFTLFGSEADARMMNNVCLMPSLLVTMSLITVMQALLSSYSS